MTKKNFEAPYLKVVTVKNDILTTSVNNEIGAEQLIQGRHGMWDEDFSEEDIY